MKRLAVLLLFAGCGVGDDWTGTVQVLENGAVRVTNSAEGVWTDETAWRLVPELAIGEVEGAEALVFGSISALEVDEDGRLYVLDRQANELRIFEPDGRHGRTVGRSGEGPGEYSAANGLVWLDPDTLVVVDQRGGRYSILTRDGEYVRTVPRRLGFYGWVFSGGRIGTRIYERSSVQTSEDDGYPVLLGTDLRFDASLESDGEPLAAAGGFVRASVDTIRLPPPDGPLYESFSVRTDRGGMVMGVPHAPTPVYYLGEDGELWHGRGHEFRILRSTLAGDTAMEILHEAVATPVSAEEMAIWETGAVVQRFRAMGGNLDMSRIPKTKPFFDDFLVDADGYLWVSVPAPSLEIAFAVFDPDGRYLGRLRATGLWRDTYLRPVVRNGRLHVVGRDELEVQRIHVFRIQRP